MGTFWGTMTVLVGGVALWSRSDASPLPQSQSQPQQGLGYQQNPSPFYNPLGSFFGGGNPFFFGMMGGQQQPTWNNYNYPSQGGTGGGAPQQGTGGTPNQNWQGQGPSGQPQSQWGQSPYPNGYQRPYAFPPQQGVSPTDAKNVPEVQQGQQPSYPGFWGPNQYQQYPAPNPNTGNPQPSANERQPAVQGQLPVQGQPSNPNSGQFPPSPDAFQKPNQPNPSWPSTANDNKPLLTPTTISDNAGNGNKQEGKPSFKPNPGPVPVDPRGPPPPSAQTPVENTATEPSNSGSSSEASADDYFLNY